MEAQESLIKTLMYSFTFTISVISLFVIILFRSKRSFANFLTINIYPILIYLYLIPILGISLNVPPLCPLVFSIGLMVDSTFHLFYERQKTDSISNIHQKTLLPIFWSNLILGGIFLLFVFVDFLPIRQFGISMSILIFIGLVFDLFVLPRLLKFND